MTRCISCGRLPTEDHCEMCHRVARAVARLADAVGYEDTAREMRELFYLSLDVDEEETNTEEANQ